MTTPGINCGTRVRVPSTRFVFLDVRQRVALAQRWLELRACINVFRGDFNWRSVPSTKKTYYVLKTVFNRALHVVEHTIEPAVLSLPGQR